MGGMGGMGGIGGMKKKVKAQPKKLGESIPTDNELECMTPTARQRVIDDYRTHKPLPDERSFLKIPDVYDRLNISADRKLLLLVCGAARGVRFTTSQMQDLYRYSTEAESQFSQVDAVYKSLSPKARKYKATANPTPTAVVEASVGSVESVEPDPVAVEAKQYHDAANRYMAAYRELVGAIVAKHGELRAREKAAAEGEGEAAVEEEVEVDKDHGEGLANAKPMPDWLKCLSEKYTNESGMKVQKSGAVLDSLGRFACFLACCVFNHLPLTPHEVYYGIVRYSTYSE
mmetsp:Transcript_5138/g.11339  ORF Transcript_5138/g.11339 Transcript_5138/m.11339 type:complete len:287 (-) Transcript_5138:68-928(-)